MKVAVFGAGAIGCWIGGRLSAGGADVTLIGRPRVIDELRGGLQVSELGDHDWKVTPALATEPAAARDAELVLVTVKSPATAEAGAALAPIVRDGTIVVSFQNGVRNADVLRETMPGHTVLAGLVAYNIARVGPGHYHRGTTGDLMVEPGASSLVAACRAAALSLVERTDMRAAQWGKLVMNLNNAINALSGRPLAEQLGDRDFRRCLAATLREALDVLDAAKMTIANPLKLPPRWIARLLPMPNALFQLVANRFASVDPHARSSMSDDFAAGRPTEIDYLQGEIVALADRVGVPAPINARLVRLVRDAEAGGKRDFTGAELPARDHAAHSMTANVPSADSTSMPSRNLP